MALRNLVDANPSRGPLVIERKDQQRVVTVSANVAGRPEGSVARDLQAELARLPRPKGHEVEVAGTFEEQEKATRELVLSFLLATCYGDVTETVSTTSGDVIGAVVTFEGTHSNGTHKR